MNQKKRCKRCERMLRTKCFVFNPLLKEEICKRCDKKIGRNKFYNPKNNRISKFNMTDDEKKVLARINGWERVNKDCKGLITIKRRVLRKRRGDRYNKMNKEKENNQLNKKFVEGLK